jgi:hypothetical protein
MKRGSIELARSLCEEIAGELPEDERYGSVDIAEILSAEVVRAREQRAELLELLKAAVACGMVPVSSAKDGGPNCYSEQVRLADRIRAAIAKAEGAKGE